MPMQHKNHTKTTKRNNKERGISLTIMDQKSIYNSIHKPQRSPNETIGFNQDGHPIENVVVMVTSRARSLCHPTQQDFRNMRTLPIYKCHT